MDAFEVDMSAAQRGKADWECAVRGVRSWEGSAPTAERADTLLTHSLSERRALGSWDPATRGEQGATETEVVVVVVEGDAAGIDGSGSDGIG
jgi:hypothetical protein